MWMQTQCRPLSGERRVIRRRAGYNPQDVLLPRGVRSQGPAGGCRTGEAYRVPPQPSPDARPRDGRLHPARTDRPRQEQENLARGGNGTCPARGEGVRGKDRPEGFRPGRGETLANQGGAAWRKG